VHGDFNKRSAIAGFSRRILPNRIFSFALTPSPSILLAVVPETFIPRSKPMNCVRLQPLKENENDGSSFGSDSVALGSLFRRVEYASSYMQAHPDRIQSA
jgi:hypothetical protein